MKDHQRVVATLLCLLLLAGGCVAPSAPAVPSAAAPPTSATAGGQTIVAIAPPATPPQTLPQWLGVNDFMTGLGGLCQLKHQLFGMLFPGLTTAMAGLEPPPALKSLTDPANLGPDAPPGVKDIAQVKADEDAAPQKIAAIKYAATIGCVKGHPGIERAFLQFLDDPTESVRYEAAKALAEMIGTPCETCPKGGCCTPKIYKKLSEIATKEKSPGCYVEYSDRVRRMARLAMNHCGAPPPQPATPGEKIEGPGKKPLPKKEKIEGPVEPPPAPGIKAAQSKPATKDAAKAKSSDAVASKTSPKLTKNADAKPAVVQTKHQSAVRRDRLQPVKRQITRRASRERPAEAGHYERRPVLMVQWERVSVPFASFSSHKDAFATASYLRARVLGARQLRSPGFKKEQVSVQTFDWTDLNTVSPSVLARTLKTLPVGKVSPILKDRQGYHLVRVLQREYRHASPPVVEMTGGTALPAASRSIMQTGGIDNAFPADDASRQQPAEQWPPNLTGAQQLQPIGQPQTQTQTQAPTARAFPQVNENEDRPPLPEPEPKRIIPKSQPEPKKPEPKTVEPKTVEPKRTEAKPVTEQPSKPQQPVPQIIDTRSPGRRIRKNSEVHAKVDGNSHEFPAGNSTPPARRTWDDFERFEPFPADRTPTAAASPKPMPADVNSPFHDRRIFGDELDPRRQTVMPAAKWDSTPPTPAGRFHLPRAAEPAPKFTPSPVRPQPEVRKREMRDDEQNALRRQQHLKDNATEPRRMRKLSNPATVWEMHERPVSAGRASAGRTSAGESVRIPAGVSSHSRILTNSATPQVNRGPKRAPSQKLLKPAKTPLQYRRPATKPDVAVRRRPIDQRRSSYRAVRPQLPVTRVEDSATSVRRESSRFVAPIEPARAPQTTPAKIEPQPTGPEHTEPSKRRRHGNVYIETGRRKPVREISFGTKVGRRSTPNRTPTRSATRREPDVKPNAARKSVATGFSRSNDESSHGKAAVDRLKPVTTNAATNRRNRTADSIRYVPIDSLRKRKSKRGEMAGTVGRPSSRSRLPLRTTAKRKPSPRSKRTPKPLYFSRSGKRSDDLRTESPPDETRDSGDDSARWNTGRR